jgi:hypothetical protein
MTDKEIKKENIETPENKPTIGYHLFHTLFPIILLNPNTDIETLKKNFFSLLDNQDATTLKQLFIGLCKTAAEMVHERKYDLSSEIDNQLLCDTPGFLFLYFSLQMYSIVELKSKTRIYIWKLPEPSFLTEPYYIAIVLLSKKCEGSDALIRYITLESSYFCSMLCEWIIKSDQGKCHANYGDCENDKNAFLERVLKLLDENRESIESISNYSLIEDRHSNN